MSGRNNGQQQSSGEVGIDDAEKIRSAFRFRNSGAAGQSSQPASPPPVISGVAPKTRPRGRILIALLLFAACSAGIFTVWENLLRYRAYGVVTGHLVEVSSPIDGVLTSVHVREGDNVPQNARLAVLSDLECRQRLERVEDELRIAEASLHAEIAKAQWEAHVQEAEMTKSMADFFDAAGTMYEETATLGVIRNELSRTQALMETEAAREVDLRNQTVQERAHTEKLDAIQKGLRVLKQRAETVASIPRLGSEQIAPLIAKVDLLLHETKRLREWLAQGDVRAPVNGIVLRRHHPAGECVRSHEPLFTVMEDASLLIEMYLPQQMTDEFRVGDTIRLSIEPFSELIPCEVVSIGAEHRQPPENIEVFYRRDVRLLPVRVRPPAEYCRDRRMAVGAVARLPFLGARN